MWQTKHKRTHHHVLLKSEQTTEALWTWVLSIKNQERRMDLTLRTCWGIASTHQTIADRRSQVADDRKESCFHIIADNRKRSQSRLLHTFRSKLHARCAGGRVVASNMADVEKEFLLQANLFLLSAVSLFAFVFEIFTVTVVNALMSRKFLHTNFTLFNASHVYNK